MKTQVFINKSGGNPRFSLHVRKELTPINANLFNLNYDYYLDFGERDEKVSNFYRFGFSAFDI
jgi:hypothetical protein